MSASKSFSKVFVSLHFEGSGDVFVNTVALFANPVIDMKQPHCIPGPYTLCVYGTTLHMKPEAIVAQQSKDQRGVTLLLQVLYPMPPFHPVYSLPPLNPLSFARA